LDCGAVSPSTHPVCATAGMLRDSPVTSMFTSPDRWLGVDIATGAPQLAPALLRKLLITHRLWLGDSSTLVPVTATFCVFQEAL
jgi:hypothetical protein